MPGTNPGVSRGFPAPATGYNRPQAEAYNRAPQPVARPQEYNRFGNGYMSSAPRDSGARPGAAFGNPYQGNRAPSSSYQRADLGERSSAFGGGRDFKGYSEKAPKSGGFHPFGGGHEPKAPKAPKMSSHEHGGGGHGGGHHR
jgi:hypothetical protein